MPGYGIEDNEGDFIEVNPMRENAAPLSRKGPFHLRWGAGNTKTSKTATIVFDLPAYETVIDGRKVKICVGAGICADYCLARGGKFLTNIKQSNMDENLLATMKSNFVGIAIHDINLILNSKIYFKGAEKGVAGKSVTPGSFRVHASGDFYSQSYLNDWFEIMRAFPRVRFYAYTKSHHLDWSRKPKNFMRVQSFGSKHDELIDTKKHHALIFKDMGHFNKVNAERRARGLKPYAYGSGIDLPSLPYEKVPVHIGLVAGRVKTGGAKKKLTKFYDETMKGDRLTEDRMLHNPMYRYSDNCAKCGHTRSFHFGPSVKRKAMGKGEHGECRHQECFKSYRFGARSHCPSFLEPTRSNPLERGPMRKVLSDEYVQYYHYKGVGVSRRYVHDNARLARLECGHTKKFLGTAYRDKRKAVPKMTSCNECLIPPRSNPKEPLSTEFVTRTGVKHYATNAYWRKPPSLMFLCETFGIGGGKKVHKSKDNYLGKRMVTKECDECKHRREREVLLQYPNIRPVKEGSLVTIVPPLCKCGHNKGIATGGFGLNEEGKAFYIDCERCGKGFDGRYARVIKVEAAPSAADRAIALAKAEGERMKRHAGMHEDEPCAVCKHAFKYHKGGDCREGEKGGPGWFCMYADHEFRYGKWEGPPAWLKAIRPELFEGEEGGDKDNDNPPIRVEEAVGEDSPDTDEVY